jgi:hypothetical protein
VNLVVNEDYLLILMRQTALSGDKVVLEKCEKNCVVKINGHEFKPDKKGGL